jgi:hypothetical protein
VRIRFENIRPLLAVYVTGRRCKQMMDDLKEKRRILEIEREVLDRSVWRTRFGRGYGPVVRQTAPTD